jgi:hypothetical protein
MNSIKPRDFVMEYLRKTLAREPTAEEYVAKNGVPAEEIEGEMVAESPRRLRKSIDRIARKARQDASRDAAQRAQQPAELRGLNKPRKKGEYIN